jgi:hypothetical protein
MRTLATTAFTFTRLRDEFAHPHIGDPSNMTQWKHCAPADGWRRFDQHQLLLNAIRDGLSRASDDWNCMNVISNFFVWE